MVSCPVYSFSKKVQWKIWSATPGVTCLLYTSGGSEETKYCSPEEAALQAVPNHLRASSTQRSEEMLSNQMLSGIPEVDLGIE